MPKGRSLIEKVTEEIEGYYNGCLPSSVSTIINEKVIPWFVRYQEYLNNLNISSTEKPKIERVIIHAFELAGKNARRYQKRNGKMPLSVNITNMDNPVFRSPEESVKELIASNKKMLTSTKYDSEGISKIIASAYVFGFLYDYDDYVVYSRYHDSDTRAKMLAYIRENQIKENDEFEIIEV